MRGELGACPSQRYLLIQSIKECQHLLLTFRCNEEILRSGSGLRNEQNQSNQSDLEGGGLLSTQISGPCDKVLIFIRRKQEGEETEGGGTVKEIRASDEALSHR